MKTARRLFSLALVLVMVLSLSVTAFATSDAPTVTVYITRGMYTAGGFDPDHGFKVRYMWKVGAWAFAHAPTCKEPISIHDSGQGCK